ncbi:hypothetical protein FACS189490_11870 [Clostridia bacterium]|nr:hypothetical protein FACS189490_11870 [Clostridia bacterium]
MDRWTLPNKLNVCGNDYGINADFRDILDIIGYLSTKESDDVFIALSLFYTNSEIPPDLQAAINAMYDFIALGEKDDGKPAQKLIDWDQDALMIIADVNKVSGQELRAEKFVHWWTFMGFFNGIGEGQLSTIVGIRAKRAKGKKLEKWEREFYKEHKNEINFRVERTDEEEARIIAELDAI